MRKGMKHKGLIMIFMIMAFISIFTITSCKPWPPVIQGVGIYGKSRYGEAVFGEEKKGTPGKALGSLLNKEDFDLWK